MPSTIRDVARVAGVSITTAHRALNGKAELSADKRARILEAARDLNYVPSAVARALVSGKTNTIGMIVTDNPATKWTGLTTGCYEEVLVHEIGHAIGFGHAAERPAIMFPSISSSC